MTNFNRIRSIPEHGFQPPPNSVPWIPTGLPSNPKVPLWGHRGFIRLPRAGAYGKSRGAQRQELSRASDDTPQQQGQLPSIG